MNETKGLIIQSGLIGDCLLTLPLARYVRDAAGLSRIDLAAYPAYADYLEGRTDFHRVHNLSGLDLHQLHSRQFIILDRLQDALALLLKEYDLVLVFVFDHWSVFTNTFIKLSDACDVKSVFTLTFVPPDPWTLHIFDWHLQQIRLTLPDTVPPTRKRRDVKTMHLTPEDQRAGQAIYNSLRIPAGKDVVLIHPGSGVRWKNLESTYYLELGQWFLSGRFQPVFVLGPAESPWVTKDLLRQFYKIGPVFLDLSLTELCGLIVKAGYVVCNDSFMSHLAAGLGAHVFTLFGPTSSQWYKPIGPHALVLDCPPESMVTFKEDLLCQMESLLNAWK